MKFTIEREHLLKPLQQISSLLVSRASLPVLNNLLFKVKNGVLSLTGTDLEIEIVFYIISLQIYEEGEITASVRKFFDICRKLPEKTKITAQLKGNYMLVTSGRSRFFLSTLPATYFPNLEFQKNKIEFTISQVVMKKLIESTYFSMAYHDVRYYLNGMLLEMNNKALHAIATDGHRLAMYKISIGTVLPECSIIIPRKSVIELMRILKNINNLLRIQISNTHIRIHISDSFIFTSKLINGCFPDYHHVLPKNPDKILELNCDAFRQALFRVAIISNERSRGVRFYISKNQLKIIAHNPEREEAEELLDITYINQEIEIGFNVNYVLDVLNVLRCDKIRILLTDSISGAKIEDASSQNATYIIMPIRI